MNATDLIYNQVKDRCLKMGCSAVLATDTAKLTVAKYLKNQFVTPSKLIEEQIKQAKKLMIKNKKGNKKWKLKKYTMKKKR